MSFVQDRMSWHDMSQGTVQQTGNPLDVAIDGEGMLVVQTAARRTLHPQRRAAAQQPRRARHHAPATRCSATAAPIVLQPTDRDIVITKDGTIKVREGMSLNSDSTRGKLRLVTLRQPAAACARTAHSTSAAPDGVTPTPLPTQAERHAGRDREIERAIR